jgi:hypothetical protein
MDPKGVEQGLESLRFRNFQTTLIHVLSPDELNPQFTGFLNLMDMETGKEKKITANEQLLNLYRKNLDQFMDRIRNICLASEIDYFPADTSLAFEDFLFDYLSRGSFFTGRD